MTATGLLLCGLLLGALLVAGGLAWRWRRRLDAAERARAADAALRLGLERRLRAETNVRLELSAALSSMSDAVVAVDLDGRVLRLNRAAGRLLSADPEAVRGRPLVEVARDSSLHDLLEETVAGSAVDDRDLRVAVADQPLDRPRRISARTAVLHDADGKRIGAVAVLRDVTELRRLEGVRRDFVANVSHELKTPVAAIKAAVETVLDMPAGAGSPEADAADRGRFLRIAARHADRLAEIIDDLLTLARLENAGDAPRLLTDWVGPVLAAAADTCRPAADEAGVQLRLRVEPGLLASMQPNLVEQAVVNLIDNAIKYGGQPGGATDQPGGVIDVSGASGPGGTAVIRVRDRGPGIAPEHLPRLFERFYRADASRSRVGGGTGLGLSIVRHVAEACGGGVAVASSVGEGATFTLSLQGPSAGERERGKEGERDGAGTAPAPPATPALTRS